MAYVSAYLGHPKLPGNDPVQPLGWWGWFDQGQTLRSTAALASGNLSPSEHHYPLGYSLLGVLFFWMMPNHPFFFVDLLSLLLAFAGFVALGRRVALSGLGTALLFAAVVLFDRILLRQWVLPWNTTAVGALVWLLLANVAAWIDGERRPGLIGLLIGGIFACRPSDVLNAVPCIAAMAWVLRSCSWALVVGLAVRLLAGIAAIALPVVALHLAIFGAAQSPYMISSARMGFTLHDFGWKAYVLLIDPYAWFSDGEGLLQHAPWIALGIAGMAPALVHGLKQRVLTAVLMTQSVLYISYVDLLPFGLWRFMNVHYFIWVIPGFALLAVMLLRDLWRGGLPRRFAAGSLLATTLFLTVRIAPARVSEARPAKAIDFTGSMPPLFDTFFSGRLAVRDALGVLQDGTDMRVFIYPGGIRVVGLRRDLLGPVAWLPGQAPIGFEGSVPSARWQTSIRLRWPPIWLRPAPLPGIPIPLS